MDIGNLLLTNPAARPERLMENFRNMPAKDQKKLMEQCRKFESVFLSKLFDQVKESIGKWGLEEGSGTKQMYSLFTTYLSRDVAEKGGMGMWKEFFENFTGFEPDKNLEQKLDSEL